MKFKSNIEVQAGLKDSSGALGTSGQVLSSTGSNVSWINQSAIASDVQNQVKAGVAINKGQAVYVTGADGTNIIVGLASNTSEATSSKTLGLLNATVAINGFADVVQIGRLSGLNTIGANAGDPVWLGTNGNLIYGLINKPYAPAHLVFLGIVTRVNANNGEIFVNVQNGFELKEIHDVDIITNVPINGDVLGYDGTLWVNKTIAEWLGYTPANANGTTNYVSKFTSATTLGNSSIFDNGSAVGIFTSAPGFVTPGRGVLSLNGSSNSLMEFQAGGAFKSYLYQSGTFFEIYDTNLLQFAVNGSERMRINSSGNVGIGTTSPSSKLSLFDSSDLWINISRGSSFVNIGVDATGTFYNTNSNHRFLYNAGSKEAMRILSNGNVGIGTTSPSEKFQIGNNFKVSNDGVTTWGVTNGNGILSWDSNLAIIGGLANTSVQFRANNAEVMRLATNGNVGIGTTSPSNKLDVAGLSVFNGTQVRSTENGSTIVGFFGNRSAWTGGALNNDLAISAYTSNLCFFTNNSVGERMRITSAGNVGIGTTTPDTKLHIEDVTKVLTNNVAGVAQGTLSLVSTDAQAANIGASLVFGGNYINSNSTRIAYAAITGRKSNSSSVNADGYLSFLTWRSTGLTEAMRITAAGDVGIGTASPTKRLDVVSSTNDSFDAIVVRPNNQTQTLNIGWQGIATSLNFIVSTNGSEKMRVTTAGNVGINTTAPIHKLSVNGKIGGDVYADSFVEFTATTETIVSADGNVVLGYAQNVVVDNEGSLGVGTISPVACAIVEIQSTNQGFLPPRMRTSERDNILGTPKPGLMIFNTDDEVIQVYTDGSGWRTLAFL